MPKLITILCIVAACLFAAATYNWQQVPPFIGGMSVSVTGLFSSVGILVFYNLFRLLK